jgi:predicted Zn-dependent peptidase
MATEVKIDRNIMPALALPDKVDIIKAKEQTLSNGIPVYYINAGTQDVVKIELIFGAGTLQQDKPLIADVTNSMLEEGTKKHNSEEIASLLDYYGAFLETGAYHDYASVTIYSLVKHVAKVMPVLEELIKEPSFPQSELDVYIRNKKQRFLVDEQKVRVVAARNFPALMFGDAHPYGHVTKIEEYDTVKRDTLQQFHLGHYSPGGCAIIVSGHVDDKLLNLIGDYFGKSTWKGTGANGKENHASLSPSKEKKHFMPKKGALQSAIKVGRPMFLKNHPDAIPFQILNTVLGGYFGSRLMSNIREDKGYTYGIGSGVIFYKQAGYFQISSEVGSTVCEKALVEVYKELDRLCNEPIPPAELQLVKNYLRGNLLRSMDGPFSLAERFKHLWLHGMGYDYYDKYIHTLTEITAKQLQDIANKYLDRDSMYELVVGAK